MFEFVGLWLSGMLLGTSPASPLAISLFLFAGILVAATPVMLGLLLYPRAGFNSVFVGIALTFFSFLVGLLIALTPLVHSHQFVHCTYHETVVHGVIVTERWCARRDSLTEDFGPLEFVGFD
jgi:hypothetical protein